jgi:predicted O-methyltransferase YrrM
MHNSNELEIEDFGAGSVIGNKKKRSISSIAKNAAKTPKLGQLLFRIANYYQPKTIIELGTSLGLSTAYLAMGNAAADVVTCEGAAAIADTARENFSLMGLKNITITVGHFDKTLQPVLQRTSSWDLVFIDGNHRKEPTLRYFEQLLHQKNESSILIFDDIHWSKEMEAAWTSIKEHPDTMLTIDLFFIGLVFFRKEFKVKQHFVIRF